MVKKMCGRDILLVIINLLVINHLYSFEVKILNFCSKSLECNSMRHYLPYARAFQDQAKGKYHFHTVPPFYLLSNIQIQQLQLQPVAADEVHLQIEIFTFCLQSTHDVKLQSEPIILGSLSLTLSTVKSPKLSCKRSVSLNNYLFYGNKVKCFLIFFLLLFKIINIQFSFNSSLFRLQIWTENYIR